MYKQEHNVCFVTTYDALGNILNEWRTCFNCCWVECASL